MNPAPSSCLGWMSPMLAVLEKAGDKSVSLSYPLPFGTGKAVSRHDLVAQPVRS